VCLNNIPTNNIPLSLTLSKEVFIVYLTSYINEESIMSQQEIVADTNSCRTIKWQQHLPISALARVPNGITIKLEVARTLREQTIGLMNRPSMPDYRGMLFELIIPQPTGFWMRNCIVPLDMIFVNQSVIQYIVNSAPPCQTGYCPNYGPSPDILIDRVIELRADRAKELGLKVGDKIDIRLNHFAISE
jgi:uncharacterized protein